MSTYKISSIFDDMLNMMPGFKDKFRRNSDGVDPIIAKSLYNVWRNASNSQNKTFKKPPTLSHDDLKKMKEDGLVLAIGDNLSLTDKGTKVIRIMILGDDRSVFEDDGTAIDYNVALSNSKGVKTAKKHKVASGWWDRFEEK